MVLGVLTALGPSQQMALGNMYVKKYMCVRVRVCMLSRFSHDQLCDPVDCSPPGSSVLVISQARILYYTHTPIYIYYIHRYIISEWGLKKS